MRAALIYPHQLFTDHPALRGADICVLVEEPLLLTQYRFHRQKLILHRASMQQYADRLRRQKRQVRYVESRELDSTGDVAGVLAQLGATRAQFVDPCDDWLQQRLMAALAAARIKVTVLDDPHFLTPWPIFEEFAAGRKRLSFTDFYVRQRKRLGLLLDDRGQPLGGKCWVVAEPWFALRNIEVKTPVAHVTEAQIRLVAERQVRGTFFTVDLESGATAWKNCRGCARRGWNAAGPTPWWSR